jgi:hypothetical protein
MREILLTRGQVALVDDCDHEELAKYRWRAQKGTRTWYAIRSVRIDGRKAGVFMHRQLMGLDDPKVYVDHADGNGLNNCRANLRRCTRSQNNANRRKWSAGCTSRYKGVGFVKSCGKWRCQIKVQNQ